jgi:hypothetical protein
VPRWPARSATAIVVAGVTALVALDLSDGSVRHWWAGHPLTTNIAAGLLVVLITVLVVDQVVRQRQLQDRSRAIAAQVAIVATQARRAMEAVTSAIDGQGDRDASVDETRTYMTMLLIAAPLLIDAQLARAFLEAAQDLGGELVKALMATAGSDGATPAADGRMSDAVERVRLSAEPLLKVLGAEERVAVTGDSARIA